MSECNELKTRLEHRLLDAVDFYRGLILDSVEQELGDGDTWTFTRGRLLKALGDRGLTGRIREILQNEVSAAQK